MYLNCLQRPIERLYMQINSVIAKKYYYKAIFRHILCRHNFFVDSYYNYVVHMYTVTQLEISAAIIHNISYISHKPFVNL